MMFHDDESGCRVQSIILTASVLGASLGSNWNSGLWKCAHTNGVSGSGSICENYFSESSVYVHNENPAFNNLTNSQLAKWYTTKKMMNPTGGRFVWLAMMRITSRKRNVSTFCLQFSGLFTFEIQYCSDFLDFSRKKNSKARHYEPGSTSFTKHYSFEMLNDDKLSSSSPFPITDSCLIPGSPISPRVKNFNLDMKVLVLSRKDNPYLSQQIERSNSITSEYSNEYALSTPILSIRKRTPSCYCSKQSVISENIYEFKKDDNTNLHDKLIRSPPPNFPAKLSHFLFTENVLEQLDDQDKFWQYSNPSIRLYFNCWSSTPLKRMAKRLTFYFRNPPAYLGPHFFPLGHSNQLLTILPVLVKCISLTVVN